MKLWGRLYPHDIGIHDRQGDVWYDREMRGAKLTSPKQKSNTLGGSVPLWYRLNHAKPPTVYMKLAVVDGRNTVAWFTKKGLRVRRGKPIELTFNYGVVPREWG